MAKKRRKRRSVPRAAAPAAQGAAPRQERKELARREREQRMRRARRRAALRRLTRLGIVLVVALAITALVIFIRGRGNEDIKAAKAAAERLGCTEIQEKPNALDAIPSNQSHQPPYEYEEHPATSGRHNPQPLASDTPPFTDPIDETLEAQAVHNLEHGYVVIYYQKDGDNALPANVVKRLEDLARQEDKVLVGPYYRMPADVSLALVAWQRSQTCPSVEDAGAVATVAQSFVQQLRGGGGVAPEPNGA